MTLDGTGFCAKVVRLVAIKLAKAFGGTAQS